MGTGTLPFLTKEETEAQRGVVSAQGHVVREWQSRSPGPSPRHQVASRRARGHDRGRGPVAVHPAVVWQTFLGSGGPQGRPDHVSQPPSGPLPSQGTEQADGPAGRS